MQNNQVNFIKKMLKMSKTHFQILEKKKTTITRVHKLNL